MIITNIIGGLGNQMFQYAFGRALSLRHAVPQTVDLREFRGYRLHSGYLLDKAFGIALPEATARDRAEVLGWRGGEIAMRFLRQSALERWRGPRLLVQDLARPAAHYLRAGADAYLLGYWQSEAYFENVRDDVRRDFAFHPLLQGQNAEWARRIAGCLSVSLHVRRGDYVTDPATLATHGLCSADYYRRAVAYIAERSPGSEFFIFSDDLGWARASLGLAHRHHFVDSNTPATSFHDMHLMSLCRHHIIANSSFSWWGAWLCEHAGKMVVAPARWLAQIPMPEVLPPSWIRL